MARKFDRKLVLESGKEFYGWGFGGTVDALYEAVFNTSMSGYQEILTDPSCAGQIVVMTYPLIGSYGINEEDDESRTPALGGLVVREYDNEPSNFRFTKTLSEAMEEHGIPGISGLDTRALTRILRGGGGRKLLLTSADTPREEAMERIAAYQSPRDQVERVSCKKRWYSRTSRHQYNVVAVDCGIKLNIIRCLNARGCNVTIVPFDTPARELLKLCPDGLLLSNGPGDPRDLPQLAELVRELRGRLPIFGIGLGCQLIGLAYGAQCRPMGQEHSGGNHLVRNLDTGKLEITSQGHAYAIEAESLAGTDLRLTHVSVLDGTPEGVCCDRDNVFAVQYQPEGAPGPQDSAYLFQRFIEMMDTHKEVANNA